jgi:arsenate reductase
MIRTAALKNQVKVRLPSGEDKEKPIVLFVCVHNAGRSRMAESFFNDLAKGRYKGLSAGTQPAPRPHPEVVRSMAEIGHHLDDGPGTMLTNDLAEEAVRVVGMGCNVAEACPALTVPLDDWELDDPKGRSEEEVAEIRDEIERRVRNLIAELDRTLVQD